MVSLTDAMKRSHDCFLFYLPLKIFRLYGEVNMKSFGIYPAPLAFERRDIFIVPDLQWQGASDFAAQSKDRPNLVAI